MDAEMGEDNLNANEEMHEYAGGGKYEPSIHPYSQRCQNKNRFLREKDTHPAHPLSKKLVCPNEILIDNCPHRG